MPSEFSKRIAAALASLGVESSHRLAVGFSGGRDSVALTEALLLQGFERLHLVHLDHALRFESACDADWVRKYASAKGCGATIERVDVGQEAARTATGIEEASRNQRYELFARVVEEQHCSGVLLAHHADDQVETLLFRLLRGAGASGLSSMASVAMRHVGSRVLKVIRPMLSMWRSEVDAFVSARGLSFVEDESNQLPRFTRNRIRHALIPELERVMHRPVKEALWRTAELLRADAEFIGAAEAALGPIPEQLDVHDLKTLPLALRRRRVARWLSERGVWDIGFELVEEVSRLVMETSPAKVNLPGGAFARRRSGRVFIECGPTP